jgi:hypothetical protein
MLLVNAVEGLNKACKHREQRKKRIKLIPNFRPVMTSDFSFILFGYFRSAGSETVAKIHFKFVYFLTWAWNRIRNDIKSRIWSGSGEIA